MRASLTLESNMQRQFHQLAEQTQRNESDLIHEALAAYLNADQHYVTILKQRVAAADRGEFASEAELAAFFSAQNAA